MWLVKIRNGKLKRQKRRERRFNHRWTQMDTDGGGNLGAVGRGEIKMPVSTGLLRVTDPRFGGARLCEPQQVTTPSSSHPDNSCVPAAYSPDNHSPDDSVCS